MKVIEFESKLTKEGMLTVPSAVALNLPTDQPIRVAIVGIESASDHDWENLAAHEMAEGYADSDAIYDQVLEP
jgi:hypothetical protein